MKKILWVLVTLSLGFGGILFYNPSENKAQAQYRSGTEQAVNYVQQKKKKSKKYYRSVSDYSVTGDASDSDAAVQPINSSTWSYYYRRVAVPGLKMSDPYPFRIQAQTDSVEGFTEDHWSGNSSYFITDGYLWQRYGYTSAPGQSFLDLGLGNYRYFNYYGGTKAKKRKNKRTSIMNSQLAGTKIMRILPVPR